MTDLVCFLEERNAEEMLRGVLPKILCPEQVEATKYIPFEGKQDLDKQIERRMRGWRTPNTKFLILRDKDSGDCKDIKRSLSDKVISSGKKDVTLIRIACHELESFYLGDLKAVQAAFPKMLRTSQENNKYRNPDVKPEPAHELRRLTRDHYQKIAGSRAIATHLTLDGDNKSGSFNVLIKGIKELMQGTHN